MQPFRQQKYRAVFPRFLWKQLKNVRCVHFCGTKQALKSADRCDDRPAGRFERRPKAVEGRKKRAKRQRYGPFAPESCPKTKKVPKKD